VAALAMLLKDPQTSVSEAVEACKHVLQLALDGAACAKPVDPVALYLEAQVGPPSPYPHPPLLSTHLPLRIVHSQVLSLDYVEVCRLIMPCPATC
jgi:hypothetical protein